MSNGTQGNGALYNLNASENVYISLPDVLSGSVQNDFWPDDAPDNPYTKCPSPNAPGPLDDIKSSIRNTLRALDKAMGDLDPDIQAQGAHARQIGQDVANSPPVQVLAAVANIIQLIDFAHDLFAIAPVLVNVLKNSPQLLKQLGPVLANLRKNLAQLLKSIVKEEESGRIIFSIPVKTKPGHATHAPRIGLGKITGSFDYKNLGPLSNGFADTFFGWRYSEVKLDADTVLWRAGIAGRKGLFYGTEIPQGVLQSRIDKAIRPRWPGGSASPIDSAIGVRIPKDTKVYVGEVSNQGGFYLGGTTQIVVPDINVGEVIIVIPLQ
jgi:hypothetical protein